MVLGLLCACSGGGSTGPTATIPQANSGASLSDNTRIIQLGSQPTSATLPVISQINGTLVFPAVASPMMISLSASASAPPGVALDSARRTQSGTLTVYDYFTMFSPVTVSLPSLPAITLAFPASTPLAGKGVYYGISDLNARGGLVSFITHGPATISGRTVSFARVPTPITFEAGHKYTFVVYATGTVAAGAIGKLYVANRGNSTLTTYNADGTPANPTISAGLSGPSGVAVDATGKLYVADPGYDALTTFNADGTQSTPTISAGSNATNGLSMPSSVAVDAAGKIYVANSGNNTLNAYHADGTQTSPTITTPLQISGVAVDATGKIYLTYYVQDSHGVSSFLDKYNADGSATALSISVDYPISGVALDAAGRIYFANHGRYNGAEPGSVTAYNPDGTPTKLTITAGVNHPSGVAVDAAGKIYVLNSGGFDGTAYYNPSITTYSATGVRTSPTITIGLNDPQGIAVR